MRLTRWLPAAFSAALLSACGGGHVMPPMPPSSPSLPVYATSFTCESGNTAVQNAVCTDPALAALDREMAASFRPLLRDADLFLRDQLLASQRVWLADLPQHCQPSDSACLAAAYRQRIAALQSWPSQRPDGPAGIGAYVQYKLLDARQDALCAALAAAVPASLTRDGSLDPQKWAGAREIAGSHGQETGDGIAVDLYQAGIYGGYQRRARSVTQGGKTLLDPASLGSYVMTLPGSGGRFGSFASQTGDYAAIDVFSRDGRLLALVTDTVGYYAPGMAGEPSFAGLFILGATEATPACLFQTYLRPPVRGAFAEQPALTPFLALLDRVRGDPPQAMAPSDRLDATRLAEETRWTLLNMPLAALAQAKDGDWTGWLRHRHDQVLDALFDWSQKSPENKAAFDQLFAQLRPAALDLGKVYREQQGLAKADAEPAVGVAMMELLYQATIYWAPTIAAAPEGAEAYRGYKPRYATLASPQQ